MSRIHRDEAARVAGFLVRRVSASAHLAIPVTDALPLRPFKGIVAKVRHRQLMYGDQIMATLGFEPERAIRNRSLRLFACCGPVRSGSKPARARYSGAE